MVRFFRKYKFIFLVCILSLNSCSNDFFGLFGSNDLNIRWQARNTFNFLIEEERSISLNDEYSFIVLNDMHIYNGNTLGLEKLKDIIDNDVKFVVFNGDLTQNGKRDDLKKIIEIAKSLGVPCYPVVGNHDIYSGNWQHWKELIGSTCYRIDGGSTTLLILDSADEYLGAKQLEWLEEELGKTKGRVFIFSHVNLFSKNLTDIQHLTDIKERAMVASLLQGRCDAMFMGHAHRRIINEAGGVKYITIEDYQSNAVYCQVWVSKENIRWEFKKL